MYLKGSLISAFTVFLIRINLKLPLTNALSLGVGHQHL